MSVACTQSAPTLSIVTICRNSAATIQRTCESVVGQQGWSGEWIVIDGGSTDGTCAILERYRSRMSYYQSEVDGGIYAAMNIGARQASGSYLLFLNGGDTLHDADVAAAFEASGARADLVVGDIRIHYPDGRVQDRVESGSLDLRERLYWRSLPHPSSFFSRDRFLLLGGYDESYRILGDREFYIRALVGSDWSFEGWSRCVSDFYNDGVSADPAHRRARLGELRRIRRRSYSIGFRIRWALNTWWGTAAQRLRDVRAGTLLRRSE